MTSHDSRGDSTRRRFLTALGAAGVAINVGGAALAQDDGTETPADGGDEPAETFVLGGRVEAWQGVAPEAISSQNNPTLELEADQTYVVVWENLDGQPHNFALLNEDGDPIQALQEIEVPEDVPMPSEELGTPEEGTPTPTPELLDVSETISEEGAMQAVQFTATDEMAQYVCQVHPNSMIGDVSLGGGDGTETPTEGGG